MEPRRSGTSTAHKAWNMHHSAGTWPSGSHKQTVHIPGGGLWHQKKEEMSYRKAREDSRSDNMGLLDYELLMPF